MNSRILTYFVRQYNLLSIKHKFYFHPKRLEELFLKFDAENITEKELDVINIWVSLYPDRELLFQKVKKSISFQKRLAVANAKDLPMILEDIQTVFPNEFSDIPGDIGAFTLERALTASLGQLQYTTTIKLLKCKRWRPLLELLIKIAVIAVLLYFIYSLSHLLFHPVSSTSYS